MFVYVKPRPVVEYVSVKLTYPLQTGV